MDTFNNGLLKPDFKRRKKRSFIQQVKKKFKKGYLISEDSSFNNDEYDYFLRVLELERNFEGTIDDKRVFANNALAQTENREVDFSYNQLVSRVVENLLPLATNEVLERYFDAFGANLRPICVHEFASHVLQALMVIATKRSFAGAAADEEVKDDHKVACSSWLLKVSKFLLNNIEEFMWDRYTNPGLRTAMLCLAGQPQLDKHSKTENGTSSKDDSSSSPVEIYDPTEECLGVLEEFYKRILDWPQFKDLIDDPLSSGYLQALLVALSHTNKKLHKKLCRKILDDCFSESSAALTSLSALFVLEAMLEQSKAKFQKRVYDQLLAGRLLEMASAKVGNITLQKFINKCCSPEIVAEIVTVLAPDFKKILSAKNVAVLVSVCQACERLKTSQSEFFQNLTKCLGFENLEENQEQLVPAILSLTPLPHETHPPKTKAGSQLLQSLFKFQKPIKLVNSLLTYEPKQLADLLSSQYGSFLTKEFCESEFIGEKSRQKLIQRLMGHYSYLAQSKFGSRTFDDVWKVADLKSKAKIVKDLASNYSEVKASKFGQFIVSKVWLDLYRDQGEDKWREKIHSVQSTKNLFATIIGDLK